jgi:hypothetical protein
MGQQNQKQQKSVEEKNGNHSIVKKMIVVKVRRLPLEMECEIFKFLKVPIQQKFIWGLGRRIYGMFGHKLLVKVWINCFGFIEKIVFLRPKDCTIRSQIGGIEQKPRSQSPQRDFRPATIQMDGVMFLLSSRSLFLAKMSERTIFQGQFSTILKLPKCHHLICLSIYF